MAHSPEPWKVNDRGDYIDTADEEMAIYVDDVGGYNAERIVACVNFCRNLETYWLSIRTARFTTDCENTGIGDAFMNPPEFIVAEHSEPHTGETQ